MATSRTRRVPHVEGDFATIVAIRVCHQSVLSDLRALQSAYYQELPFAAQPLNLELPLPSHNTTLGPHISLSLTQYLKIHQLECFVTQVAKVARDILPFTVRILSSPLYQLSPTPISATTSACPPTSISNSEGTLSDYTYSFGVLQVDPRTINTALGALLCDIDSVIKDFGGHRFPQPYKPHISLFYIASQGESHIFEELLEKQIAEDLDICFTVRYITVRIGKCHINLRLGAELPVAWTVGRILAEQSSGGDCVPVESCDDEDNDEDVI